MNNETQKNFVATDALASVVVFLVALPLCMGIALASGVPVERGIVTGIIGGLVVGFLAGQPLQVSGPAAGLSVMVWELVHARGVAALGVVVMIAGTVQLIAGLSRLGQWFRAVSPPVIQGMLAGIGVLIVSQQWYVLFDGKPRGSGLQNLAGMAGAVQQLFVTETHRSAALIAMVALASMIAWTQYHPHQLRNVPAALVAVAVSSLLAWALHLNVSHVAVPHSVSTMMALPTMASLHGVDIELIRSGFAFALVASAETLLCATAVDQMHKGARTKYDRELAAQGVGNILCGIAGALPMTGVIVRSAANVNAGGRTRLSAILHGVWLLLAVVLFSSVLNLVPTAALAAVLVHTGYKLINPKAVRRLWAYSRVKVLIYSATLGTIILSNLLEGVLIGMAFALADLVHERIRMDVSLKSAPEGWTLKLSGAATFLLLPRIATTLERVPRGAALKLDAKELEYVDLAVLELLRSFQSQHALTGGTFDVDWVELEAHGRLSRRVAIAEKGEAAAVLAQLGPVAH